MSLPATSNLQVTEKKLLCISRELARGLLSLDQILENNEVSQAEFDEYQQNPRFQQMLGEQVSEWQSADNTPERLKLKAAAALEDWLPELHARIHDRTESLTAKIEGGKLLAKLSGVGEKSDSVIGGGERFSVTINIGDQKVSFEKMKTIDAEALDAG
jgi:hypothetical protein